MRLRVLSIVAALACATSAAAATSPRAVYVVERGDTLYSIAHRFGTTVADLARLNGMKPGGLLLAGKRLRLPTQVPAQRAQPAPPKAVPPLTLEQRLRRALRGHGLSLATTAVYVLDLQTGQPVFELNPDLPIEPASIEKLPLALALLRNLGPAFRTHTDVLGVGTHVGSTWQGDLVLKGYGDPSLHRDDLARLASQVRAAGIRTVTGRLVADESYFDSERGVAGWKPSFVGEESPPLSALVVDRARVDRRLAADPASAALILFRRALLHAGVTVGPARVAGAAPAGATLLGSVASPRLATLVTWMLKQSDNYVAETLLKELGARVGGAGTSAAGAAVVLQTLRAVGLDTSRTAIVDGSGLSQEDRISARTLVQLLAALRADTAVGPIVMDALPVAGVDGTLRHRLLGTRLAGVVRAKSGTTDESSGLAGYVGSRYAFALVENGAFVPAWTAHAAQDRFLKILGSARTAT